MSQPYEAVIGLEVHCQLLTESKAFSPETARFVRDPNAQIDFVSLGYPGTLPVLNERVVEFAVRLGIATSCSIRNHSTLSRKHYFYPDLPKGYQISQFEDPICYDGYLEVSDEVGKPGRRIRIKRIHLEEDAGKSIHDRTPEESLLDFNRCGVPLLELVTCPDIRTPEEAHEFVKRVRQIVRYLRICDGNMEEGSLRCDANVSIRPIGSDAMNAKTEIKNLNSMRHVQQALQFEIDRQTDALQNGGVVEQETRLWDPSKMVTRVMRTKEMAHDYRYFPDPDLPPVVVSPAVLAHVKQGLPELSAARRDRFQAEFRLSSYDATLLTEERNIADYFEEVVDACGGDVVVAAKTSANFILTKVLRSDRMQHATGEWTFAVPPGTLGELLSMRVAGELSSSAATELYEALDSGTQSVRVLASELNLLQVSDASRLVPMVDAVLTEFPSQVQQYLDGKTGLLGFLIGKVMKKSGGAADPTVVKSLIEDRINPDSSKGDKHLSSI